MRIALMGLWLALATTVSACPMCASGDPSELVREEEYRAYKSAIQVPKLARWSVTIDARTIGSSESAGEEHRQSQVAVSAAYRFTNRLFVFGRLPYSSTTLTEDGEHDIVNSGIGDAELMGSYELPGELAGWHPGVSLGLKLPTGDNNVQADDASVLGSRLDHGEADRGRLTEHGQIGTGGWDVMTMAHMKRPGQTRIYATLGYRINGENDYGYTYGEVLWLDVMANRNVAKNLSAGLGARWRYTAANTHHGAEEVNSGGTIVALLPEVAYQLGEGLRLSLQTAIPVINALDGEQTEKVALLAGFTHSF